jgi:cytochrome c biogenesis protein CcdA
MVFLGQFLMKALGLSMIVGGMAFLFSGLVFLLPTERKLSARKRSFEESQEELEYYLSQMRKERG